MKVLLASTASYVPPRGGSTRSNLVWLEHLARQGHEIRVVCGAPVSDAGAREAQLKRELAEQGIDPAAEAVSAGVTRHERNGIQVWTAEDIGRQRALLHEQIAGFQPDWILISSEDLGHVLLREAFASSPSRVVYLAHTPQFYPFGPESWNPDPAATSLIRNAAGIVAISRTMSEYIRQHAGAPAVVIHPPIYGEPPYAQLGSFENPMIGMVNPCAVKGISIFAALAEAHPELQFAALPGWGTTTADRKCLSALPNVALRPGVSKIDEFLKDLRILLVPSVWQEGFGLIAMEAMLRGIPVIASNSGGLNEAKTGTGYVIPVRPIERYESEFDERHMPVPILPQQDLTLWSSALERLSRDKAEWEREAAASRNAASRFVGSLDAGQFSAYLSSLRLPDTTPQTARSTPAPRTPDQLTPEKRALLLQRLKKQSGHPS